MDPVCLLSPPFAGVLCLVLMMIFPLPLHPLILVHEMHNCVQYRMPAPVIYTEISRRRMDATYEPLLLKSLVIHGEVMIGAIDPHLQSMCSIGNTRHFGSIEQIVSSINFWLPVIESGGREICTESIRCSSSSHIAFFVVIMR